MPKDHYLIYLKHRLLDVDARMETAKHRLEHGGVKDKVRAAGALKILENQETELRQKIGRLEKESDNLWEDLKTEIDEDFDVITASIENWIETH